MTRFIVLTFGFLFWGYYELSGGGDFGRLQQEARAAAAKETDVVPGSSGLAASGATGDAPGDREVATRADSGGSDGLTRISITGDEARVVRAVSTEPAPRAAATMPTVRRTAPETPAPAPEAAPATVEMTPAAPDMREVSASRVNMRNGPGTNFSVLAKLRRGDRIEVLQDPGDGWIKLRVADTNRVGWMADYLVTAASE